MDDFHMAGRTENLAKAWALLRKKMDLGPSISFHQNTYLGCTQTEVAVNQKLVKEKQQMILQIQSSTTKDLEEVNPDTEGYSKAKL